MAQLGGTFDASQVDPSRPMMLIPAGKYPAHIINSEMRPTKEGDGQMLWLEEEITEGEYQGQKFWDRLNLVNKNPQAAEIAQRQLSAICHATGMLQVDDSEQLHFRPMMVTIEVQPERPEIDKKTKQPTGKIFKPSNEVKGYEPIGAPAVAGATTAQPPANPAAQLAKPPFGAPPAGAAAQPAAAATAQAGKAASPPWRRTA